MNILPKKYSEFKDKSYWNNFFNQLKNTEQQNFQWYGDYFDFKDQLKKILKQIHHKNNQGQKGQENKQNTNQLNIFHIGCGKSTFGQDVQLQYPDYNVINTDYSEQIIKDMIKRTLLMKTMCKYEVCDMFEPLAQKYQQKFNVVLDKGTLDAILPEDVQEQINRIKNVFFKNVQSAFNPKQTCSYIIISMLQPFVLRTILQHFYKKNQYQIQIQQSKIKQSRMQPFLVYVKRYGDSEQRIVDKITLKLLKGNKQINFSTIQQTLKRIQQLQQTVASQQKVKKLSPHQHLTYNISNPQQPQKLRYTIEIIDNQESKLKQNTCSVFIVPQGKQNSFLFSNVKGLKILSAQVGSSRLIVIKLLSGNTFKSIDQVKTQINPLMTNFIQEGCAVNQVPFMTDAEELGVRKYVYQNQRVYVQEILAGQNEAFRRVILKQNLSLVQTQFKLFYGKSQQNQQAKQVQKKTKILPAKKGKFIVIDKQYLDEGYCQSIVAGITKLIQVNEKRIPNLLVLGGGGYSIPKYLYENLSIQPKVSTVQSQKTLCCEQLFQIFQILPYTKSQDFKVINDDAYSYIMASQMKQQLDGIIVDICTDKQPQLPPRQYLTQKFISKCYQLLNQKYGGVLIFNVLRKGFLKKELKQILQIGKFDLAFVSKDWDEGEKQQTEEQEEEDCLVLYLVKISSENRKNLSTDTKKLAQLGQQLLKLKKSKGKSSKGIQLQLKIENKQWIDNQIDQIKLIYPQNKSNIKF